MDDVFIVGRLLSENRGIDSIISHVSKNPKIRTVNLRKGGWEHRASYSLFELHKNKIDGNGRIVGLISQIPTLPSQSHR